MSGIWFTSCKTSRNMETQKQVDYSGELSRIQSIIESLRADASKQTKITTDKLSDLKIENKTVYLSLPDSTGKQYPVKESTTTLPNMSRKGWKLMNHYLLPYSSSPISWILLVIR